MCHSSIKEALLSHPKGPPILEAIDDGHFNVKYRKALVRIATSELVKFCGNYPSNAQKWALAQAFVEEFPALKCNLTALGCEQYFDPVTKKGFITHRLENMRKNLNIGDKKYKKRTKSTTQEKTNADTITLSISENEILQKIELMSNSLPNVANKAMITENMCSTFHARRQWIHRPNEDVSKQPTVLQIVDKFPRIIDYNGELMELEYLWMTENENENANGLLSVFPVTYTKRILEYCKTNGLPLYEELIKDDDLRALALLISLLPRANFTIKRKANEDVVKRDGSFPNKQFLQIKPNGINVEEIVFESRANPNQAYLLALETKQIRNPYVYFIVSEATPIQLESGISALSAVTALWKFHYVFNIEYAKDLKFFYNFIDSILYKKNVKVLPSVRSLNVNLLNFKI